MSEPREWWVDLRDARDGEQYTLAHVAFIERKDYVHVVEASALDDLREKYTKLMHVNEDLLGQNELLRDALMKILNPWDGDPSGCTEEIARKALEKP